MKESGSRRFILPAPGVREATSDDLPAIREIAAEHGNLDSWPSRPDFLDHELATGAVVVAGAPDEPTDGFGGFLVRDGVAHLADMFVRKRSLGSRLGSAILRALLEMPSVAAAHTRVTSASSDPRAISLYARAGMQPLIPVLYLSGGQNAALRVAAPERLPVEAGPEDMEAIVELDTAASGRARPEDHGFLASLPEARAFVLRDRVGARAYAWARFPPVIGATGRREAFVAMAGARTEVDMADVMTGVVLAAASDGAPAVHFTLLGPNPALVPLLEAGFRIVDRDIWMASRPDVVDGRTYTPSLELG